LSKRQDAIAAVIERDRVCFDCGTGDQLELHHIIARSAFGKHNREQCWTEKNMIMLCADCHRLKDKQAGSHTHAARVRHLQRMQAWYSYEGKPWSAYVGGRLER